MGIAALVLGIVAIALSWTGFGIIPGIVGFILGLISFIRKKDKRGLVGMILSVLTIGVAVFFLIKGFISGMSEPVNPTYTTGTQPSAYDTDYDSKYTYEDSSEIDLSGIFDDIFSNDGKKEEKEEEKEDSVKKNKEGKKYEVGDTIEGKNWKLTYIGCGDFTPDNQFYEAKADKKLVYVEVEVENIADHDQLVASSSFDAYADGYECDWYISKEDLSATLSPGRKATGKSVYEVPKDAKSIEFEFHDGLFSSDKIILIVK